MKTERRARPSVAARGRVASLALAASAMGLAPGERAQLFRADPGWGGHHELDGKTNPLPGEPGRKADGAAYNRFRMFNQQSTAGGLEVYFDDLVLDGMPEDRRGDPSWNGGAR